MGGPVPGYPVALSAHQDAEFGSRVEVSGPIVVENITLIYAGLHLLGAGDGELHVKSVGVNSGRRPKYFPTACILGSSPH